MKAKYVSENNFERKLDPKKSMDIGAMKRIREWVEEDDFFAKMGFTLEVALRKAAMEGNFEMTKLLIGLGADIHVEYRGRRDFPLINAVAHNDNLEVIEELLKAGCDPNLISHTDIIHHDKYEQQRIMALLDNYRKEWDS